MDRLTFLGALAGLATLALGTPGAAAQESGGIALSPEVFKTNNAQGQVLDHVLARAQQLQQLRLLNLPGGGAVTSSNLANPAAAAPSTDPQSLGAARTDILSLASTLRARAQQPPDPVYQQIFQEQYVDNSKNLLINAPNSSVSIGSNNVVSQQVSTSTAVSPTGNAAATAGVNTASSSGTNKNATNQAATSAAMSMGGAAQAVAINSNSASRLVP